MDLRTHEDVQQCVAPNAWLRMRDRVDQNLRGMEPAENAELFMFCKGI